MKLITAAAIQSPTTRELVIGAIILLLLMGGFSFGVGWIFSKLFDQHNRRKAFLWISSLVLAALLFFLVILLNLFVF